MQQTPARTNRGDLAAAALTAVATWLASWFTLRHGVAFSPDAWTYWTSSVSLLEGRGYVDAHGLPVTSWPIGYSLWLACVQSVVGVSVAAVRVADSVAMAAFAGLATYWGFRRTVGTGHRWLVGLAAGVGAVAAARGCNSEFLMLVCLFATLLAADGIGHAGGARFVLRTVLVTGFVSAAVLTRHAALAFLPGLWFLFVEHDRSRWRATIAWSLVCGVTAIVWWAMRHAFDQGGTFPFFSGQQSLSSMLSAMVRALDRGLGVFPLGVVWFVVFTITVGNRSVRERLARWLRLDRQQLRQGAIAGLVWTSLLALLAMFLLVYIADPPGRRFVRFASLIVAVITAGVLRSAASRWRWLVLVLVLVPPAVPVVRDVVRGHVGEQTTTATGGESFLPLHAVPGPPGSARELRDDGKLSVPVPLFVWQRDELERMRRGR